MSVIAKLDQQVDAILLAPIEKKHLPEAETLTDTGTNAEERVTLPTTRESEPRRMRDAHARDSSLPVWLL